mmetsp:Transcript_33671/g.85136  ORF Transcript_33671/g.85136 Transcript_33671/m.85136 type:complete len:218 (-) Transcript_33671:1827-2480(-)
MLLLHVVPDHRQDLAPRLHKLRQELRHQLGAHQAEATDGDGGVLEEPLVEGRPVDEGDEGGEEARDDLLHLGADAHRQLPEGPRGVVAHADVLGRDVALGEDHDLPQVRPQVVEARLGQVPHERKRALAHRGVGVLAAHQERGEELALPHEALDARAHALCEGGDEVQGADDEVVVERVELARLLLVQPRGDEALAPLEHGGGRRGEPLSEGLDDGC